MLESLPYPLHPIVVHFPIALFITAFLFELSGLLLRKEILHQTAIMLYVLAALIAPLVVRTGHWEAGRLDLNHPVLDKHSLFAAWLMWVSLMSLPLLWLLYKKNPKIFRICFVLFAICAVVLITFTGHYGGRMVYEYGVGTG